MGGRQVVSKEVAKPGGPRVAWIAHEGGLRASLMGATLLITPEPGGYHARVEFNDETLYDAGPMALSSAKLSCRNVVINDVRAVGQELAEQFVDADAGALAVLAEFARREGASTLCGQPDALAMALGAWARALVRQAVEDERTRCARLAEYEALSAAAKGARSKKGR